MIEHEIICLHLEVSVRIVKLLFWCHIAALALALGGLLLVISHPIWTGTSVGFTLWPSLLHDAGELQILFGAATMLFFGWLCVGPRKTLVFLVASLLTSLLLGLPMVSTTVLPGLFPPEMTALPPENGQGISLLLLSWFYMEFTSYLVACKLVLRLKLSRPTLWSLALGTYFLIAWAAALHGALENIPVSAQTSAFHLYGSTFEMPVYNALSWIIMCLLLLCVIQLLWRDKLNVQSLTIDLPVGVYTANIGFVLILSFGTGLWFPLFFSALFVLAPEALALYPREDAPSSSGGGIHAMSSQAIWLILRGCTLVLARRRIKLSAEGLEHIPRSGAVLIVARHFHYIYDGYIFLRVIPRRLHILVALDWLQVQGLRLLIELGCGLADWPVVLRGEEMKQHSEQEQWVYQPLDGRRYLRQIMHATSRLLRAGEVLVIFPEGYPNVDPHPTLKADLEAFLPFQPGFVRIAERAQKDGHTHIAIVPAGLAYTKDSGKHWQAHVRFGSALFLEDFANSDALLSAVEERVQALSYTPSSPVALRQSGETRRS